jgi:cellulose synthase/poly-beta-1,6-N-acetylglucosamine synthase-like glycosyltransferase
VFVLTGTATLFRSRALLDVAASRGTLIPGTPGLVYDVEALTEDNELTLALKSLGAFMMSPRECFDTTEVMPTLRMLWNQRKRWQRGALENLGAYGFTPATLRYWGQQIGIAYGVVALNAFVVFALLTLTTWPTLYIYTFWLALALVFMVERVATVWSGGWRARLLALPLVIEIFYALYLQLVVVASIVELALGRRASWSGTRSEQEARA